MIYYFKKLKSFILLNYAQLAIFRNFWNCSRRRIFFPHRCSALLTFINRRSKNSIGIKLLRKCRCERILEGNHPIWPAINHYCRECVESARPDDLELLFKWKRTECYIAASRVRAGVRTFDHWIRVGYSGATNQQIVECILCDKMRMSSTCDQN